MTKKKAKKTKTQNSRRPAVLLFLGVVLVLLLLKFFVSCSIQDMENSAFRDEQNQRLMSVTTTASVKQTVAYAFDPEAIIAQQIERAVSYRTQTHIEPLLKNIQENLQYNRNKAAIWFYLAYAYEQIGNTANAVAIYEDLRKQYEDRQVMLYIFNAPRELGSGRAYSVSLVAESLLRQALLLKDERTYKALLKSNALYGEEGAVTLSYSALAAYNLKHLESPKTSVESYVQSMQEKETMP
jgi:tetratricopeptide (TPR) repeat protein